MNIPGEIPVRCNGIAVYLFARIDQEWHVLLLKRADSLEGAWCQVAGGIRDGEKAWQAALRETKEETGLIPDKFYSANICEQFYHIRRDEIYIAPIFVGFVPGSGTVRLNDEHSDHAWLSLDEAVKRLDFAGQRESLESIWERFIMKESNVHLEIRNDFPG
jgi:dATP pyrophosphohydrolase